MRREWSAVWTDDEMADAVGAASMQTAEATDRMRAAQRELVEATAEFVRAVEWEGMARAMHARARHSREA